MDGSTRYGKRDVYEGGIAEIQKDPNQSSIIIPINHDHMKNNSVMGSYHMALSGKDHQRGLYQKIGRSMRDCRTF